MPPEDKRPQDLLAAAMHYVIETACGLGLAIGTTMLCKVIFYAEYLGTYETGLPLLGVKIVKAPFGPVPDGHKDAIRSLLDADRVAYDPKGRRYDALRKCDPALLTDSQREILAHVTKELCTSNLARTITEATHRSLVWQAAEMGEELPVAMYFETPEEPTPEELDEDRKWAEEHDIWGAG
jgi:hypothetical protein